MRSASLATMADTISLSLSVTSYRPPRRAITAVKSHRRAVDLTPLARQRVQKKRPGAPLTMEQSEPLGLTRDADCTDASKAVKPPAARNASAKIPARRFRHESSAKARLAAV